MSSIKHLLDFFKNSLRNANEIVGMNKRNLSYVYPNNPRKYFEYANDKLLTKQKLQEYGVSVPKTYMRISYFYELKNIQEKLRNYSNFVIKPSSGSGGNGIIVINDYKDDVWISVSSKKYDFADITKHVADIIFGVYSFGLNDTAIIEERIIQNEQISKISPYGLADVRVINYKGQNVKAMLRIATLSSGGKANLHQGGIGVAIDLKSGVSFNAQQERQDIKYHPDTGISLLNVKVPYWKELLSLCEKTAKAIPMEYLGIDVAIGENGPLILEVNARPGIEIQNISHSGMLKDLNKIDYKGLA